MLLRFIRNPDKAIRIWPSVGVRINEVPLYSLYFSDIAGGINFTVKLLL